MNKKEEEKLMLETAISEINRISHTYFGRDFVKKVGKLKYRLGCGGCVGYKSIKEADKFFDGYLCALEAIDDGYMFYGLSWKKRRKQAPRKKFPFRVVRNAMGVGSSEWTQ